LRVFLESPTVGVGILTIRASVGLSAAFFPRDLLIRPLPASIAVGVGNITIACTNDIPPSRFGAS